MIKILPDSPLAKTPAFKAWCEIHEIRVNDCYQIEIHEKTATIYYFALNERGKKYVEFNVDNPKPGDGEIAKLPPETIDLKCTLKVTKRGAN